MFRTTRPSVAFAAVALSVASFSTLQSLLVPVLPMIQADLHTTPEATTWTLTAWLITAAVATPVLGRVGDLAGKRRTMLVALAAITLGSVIAALAPTIGVLIGARVLQGLGGAIFPLAYGILRDALPAERVPSAIGATSAVLAIGSGIGIVLAGPLSLVVGWRGLFLVPIVLVVVGAALVVIGVPESRGHAPGRISASSALLLSAWLVALMLPLSSGARWGWTAPSTLGLLALAIVLLVLWVRHEARSDSPLVDMRLMRRRAIWTTNLASLLIGASMFGVFAFLPRFVQTPASSGYGFGESIQSSGLIMLPMLVMMAVAGFSSGPLTRVLPMRGQLGVGALLIAGSAAAMGLFHHAPWQVVTAGATFGLGLGIAYAAMTTLVVAAVPASQTGIATGMNTNLRTIGGALGSAVMSSLVFGSLDPAGLPLEPGYTAAFLVLAVLALGAGVVALGLRVPAYETQPARGTELDQREGVTQPVSAQALVA